MLQRGSLMSHPGSPVIQGGARMIHLDYNHTNHLIFSSRRKPIHVMILGD
jgi:hypothetical protein